MITKMRREDYCRVASRFISSLHFLYALVATAQKTHNVAMAWDVEYTDEFAGWWHTLAADAQDAVDRVVGLLEVLGPALGYPYSTGITTSRHGPLRELRVQHRGHPLRILYAFDPRRVAILLLGDDKMGHERWYEVWVPVADRLYDEHLAALHQEGLL